MDKINHNEAWSSYVLQPIMFLVGRIKSHSLYIIVCTVTGYFLHDVVKVSNLLPASASLQNLSSAVFALSGVWIAYTYPQAIAAYTNPTKAKLIKNKDTERITSLVLVIITSAFVASSIFLFSFLHPILSILNFDLESRNNIRIAGITSLLYLSFLQLKAIALVVLNNIIFANELEDKRIESEANDDL